MKHMPGPISRSSRPLCEALGQRHGVGMKPEVRNRLFEPFFTTRRKARERVGFINRLRNVKQSGGNIWFIVNRPGNNLQNLPARVDEPLAELREQTIKEELPGGKETILMSKMMRKFESLQHKS